jgi:hypothetical protein
MRLSVFNFHRVENARELGSVYRERAAAWRDKAASLPEDDPHRGPS